jgi:2'-5' RNA ligase
MDQQLDLLSTDPTRHNVYLAALPDALIAACAEEIAGNKRRRFGLTAKPISPERLHVSLLAAGDFSGSCPPSVIDAALRAAGTVSMERSGSSSIASRAFPEGLGSERSC